MSQVSDLVLEPLVRKLEHWHPLNEDERRAVLALPHFFRELAANQFVVWDGDRPQHSCMLASGFAYRHKLAGNGARQILSIHMKGDMIDLQNSLLGVADHNVQMITAGRVAFIPVDAVREIAFRLPAVGMAMWYETLVEGSIFREWVLNVGRRDAFTAIAHLLCEFAIRMEVAGLGQTVHYELPLTQEQLADAVGLTSVHVNRHPDAAGGGGAYPPQQARHPDRRLEKAGQGRGLRAALSAPGPRRHAARSPRRYDGPSGRTGDLA